MNIRQKLASYALVHTHTSGGPKARGFELLLGITLDQIDYLETEIRSGILKVPVSAVRPNHPHGFNCVVELQIRGVEKRAMHLATVRTVWEMSRRGSRPRLVTAFPRS